MSFILPNLPEQSGVYRYFDHDENLLYVGKAINLKKRVQSYFQGTHHSPRIALMVKQIARVEITITTSEQEALLLEHHLIQTLAPRYNIVFRDDKCYPHLKLSNDDYPRISYYRGQCTEPGQYFGPFPHAKAVRESIKALQKIFRLRSCEDSVFHHRSRPCLLFQIRQCSGPCVGMISKAEYRDSVNQAGRFLHGETRDVLRSLRAKMQQYAEQQEFEYAAQIRDRIDALNTLLKQQHASATLAKNIDILVLIQHAEQICIHIRTIRGGRHLSDRSYFPKNMTIAATDDQEIMEAFILQHYLQQAIPDHLLLHPFPENSIWLNQLEKIANQKIHFLRPQKKYAEHIQAATQSATFSLEGHLSARQRQTLLTQALIETLNLAQTDTNALHIECFDISHTMGEATQASCVVYFQHNVQPKFYRRWNIKGITGGDDCAALTYAVSQRYQNPEAKRPDLIIIDGGTAQVSAASYALFKLGFGPENIVGLSKGKERIVGEEVIVFADHRPALRLGKQHPALMLLAKIRDEAHRFAITGMRAKRDQTRRRSRLEDITGIGQKRRQKLLTHFAGLNGVLAASVDDLSKVDGISRALAEKIYQQLRDDAERSRASE